MRSKNPFKINILATRLPGRRFGLSLRLNTVVSSILFYFQFHGHDFPKTSINDTVIKEVISLLHINVLSMFAVHK